MCFHSYFSGAQFKQTQENLLHVLIDIHISKFYPFFQSSGSISSASHFEKTIPTYSDFGLVTSYQDLESESNKFSQNHAAG